MSLTDWSTTLGLFVGVLLTTSCGQSVEVGSDLRRSAQETPAGGSGGTVECVVTECARRVYACGDCVDNDLDGLVDSQDPDCLGPCQNAEDSFHGAIPGQSGGGCQQDCYFDQDSGRGNDGCDWSHQCDPLAVAPDYPPQGEGCAFEPDESCDAALESQSAACHDFCLPRTPNGCDCFGCCAIPGAPTPVWIGSELDRSPSCTRDTLDDPKACKPCTQVESCLNTCERCERCVGKPDPAEDCEQESSCPDGVPECGASGQAACPLGSYCITGCCRAIVR